MKILIIDNFDSFTYNIVHILESLGAEIDVKRVDKIDIEQISIYNKIIISPGPGLPSDNKILLDIINKYKSEKSILGICLGHQAIALAFGSQLFNTEKINHGVSKNTIIIDKNESLFDEIETEFMSGRYHSWAIKKDSLPIELTITAIDDEGIIMAISHKNFDVKGIQFHPESVLTPHGKLILKNWFKK